MCLTEDFKNDPKIRSYAWKWTSLRNIIWGIVIYVAVD
jgi:hypothetical protein